MKVTFLVPPVLDGTRPTERASGCTYVVYPVPNIYELTVAACLIKEGHDVRYLDFVLEKKGKKEFIDFLKTDDSDAYCMWTVNLGIKNDNVAKELIKQHKSESFVLFLGPAPTQYTREFLDKKLTDKNIVALRGEPDLTLVELLFALENKTDLGKIKGISYVDINGKIIHNPARSLIEDLDILPLPARHLVEKYEYHNPKLKQSPYTMVVTSRNCPHKCIYCVPSSLTFARELEYKKTTGKKPPISFRSTKSIRNELKVLAQKGYTAVSFQDDNFIWDEQRLKEIADALKKYNFVWGAQARVDRINENIAKILGESNCKYIDLGVESFDQKILDYVKKGITEEQIYSSIELLQKYNVPVKLNILLGTSPYETKESIKKTFKKVKELKVEQVMFNIVAPFPGTEFYDLCIKNNWIKEYTPTDVQKNAIVNYPNLSAKDMEKLLFKGNIGFYLRPAFVAKQITKFKSPKDFYSAAKALWRKLF